MTMKIKTASASAKKGISPIISTVMIIAITFAAVGIVMTIVLPSVDRAKEAALLNEAVQNMRVIDNMVREVASEGTGSLRRTAQLLHLRPDLTQREIRQSWRVSSA